MHDGPLQITAGQLDANIIQIAIYYAASFVCSLTCSMPCIISLGKDMTGVCKSLQRGHEEAGKQAYTRGVDCTVLT